MTTPLYEVCRASLPRAALPILAGLRGRSGVQVTLEGERVWVSWPDGDEEVLRRVLPVSGVELYVCRDGLWHRFGRHLPSFGDVSETRGEPLDRVLYPAPVQSVSPPLRELRPVALRLAPDQRPRQASAGAYALPDVTAWADTVPTVRLQKLLAACQDGRVLLLGQRLPPLLAGERFWGERVLVPLGYSPEPALPESALREALGATEEELLLLKAVCVSAKPQAAVELIPRAVFEPLTRAGLRLALREAEA